VELTLSSDNLEKVPELVSSIESELLENLVKIGFKKGKEETIVSVYHGKQSGPHCLSVLVYLKHMINDAYSVDDLSGLLNEVIKNYNIVAAFSIIPVSKTTQFKTLKNILNSPYVQIFWNGVEELDVDELLNYGQNQDSIFFGVLWAITRTTIGTVTADFESRIKSSELENLELERKLDICNSELTDSLLQNEDQERELEELREKIKELEDRLKT
jgi:hypothetical protein